MESAPDDATLPATGGAFVGLIEVTLAYLLVEQDHHDHRVPQTAHDG
jgi:hypothetical protein